MAKKSDVKLSWLDLDETTFNRQQRAEFKAWGDLIRATSAQRDKFAASFSDAEKVKLHAALLEEYGDAVSIGGDQLIINRKPWGVSFAFGAAKGAATSKRTKVKLR